MAILAQYPVRPPILATRRFRVQAPATIVAARPFPVLQRVTTVAAARPFPVLQRVTTVAAAQPFPVLQPVMERRLQQHRP